MIAAGEFLEWAEVYRGRRYGTPHAFVDERLAGGFDVLLEIDVQGAAQVRAHAPDARLRAAPCTCNCGASKPPARHSSTNAWGVPSRPRYGPLQELAGGDHPIEDAGFVTSTPSVSPDRAGRVVSETERTAPTARGRDGEQPGRELPSPPPRDRRSRSACLTHALSLLLAELVQQQRSLLAAETTDPARRGDCASSSMIFCAQTWGQLEQL